MFPLEQICKDGRTVAIRRVSPDDAQLTVDYANEVSGQTDYLGFGIGEFERTAEEQESRLSKIATADNQLFLLAMVNNNLAGMIGFGTGRRPRTRHAGEFGMSVHEEYWGLGIGSMLLQALVDWSHTKTFIRKINLKVRCDNQAAIRLYKRKQFKLEGTITKDFQVDGVLYDAHCMGLEVNEDTHDAT